MSYHFVGFGDDNTALVPDEGVPEDAGKLRPLPRWVIPTATIASLVVIYLVYRLVARGEGV